MRRSCDPYLPRRIAMVELLFFPGFRLWLVVPSLFVFEPMLDRARLRLHVKCPQLRLDQLLRSLGLGSRCGVHEDLVAVTRDGEPTALEPLGELPGLVVQLDPEPLEQPLVHVLDLDADAPIVVRHRPEPSLRAWTAASGTSARRRGTRPASSGSPTSGSSFSSRMRPGRPGCPCSWWATVRQRGIG